MGVLFSVYITFTVLAMLNVVTGVFIGSVMKHASDEKEERTRSGLKRLFRVLGWSEGEEISWEEYEAHLGSKEMKEFFRTIDVDIANATALFELLDSDNSGSLNSDEFLDGCLKIWQPCQSLDLKMIHRDLLALSQSLGALGIQSTMASSQPDTPRT